MLRKIIRPVKLQTLQKCILYLETLLLIAIRKSVFLAGSCGEGLIDLSNAMGVEFDCDIMITINEHVVVEQIEVEENECCDTCKLENVPSYPCYAWLKILKNGEYVKTKDIRENFGKKLGKTNITELFGGRDTASTTANHGPAVMLELNHYAYSNIKSKSIDIVFAIHCNEWPSIAENWSHRVRLNWPAPEMVARVMRMGCDLVPAGFHEQSSNEKEWRISFVRAERYLMHSLNKAQLKTYILLKIVFKCKFLSKDFKNKVSSYIAKCSFFWISEEYDGSEWKESESIKYLWLCLQKIKSFVENGNFPHYFMKECNVLLGKLQDFEKEHFSKEMQVFTEKRGFKERILNLICLRNDNQMKETIYQKCANVENFDAVVVEKIFKEVCATMLQVICLPFSDSKDSMEQLQNLLCHMGEKITDSMTIVNESSLQDFCVKFLMIIRIRLQNVAFDRDTLDRNGLEQVLERLISKADLNLDTVCIAQSAQIAHLFFTNRLYENVLEQLSPLLLKLQENPSLAMQFSNYFSIFSPFDESKINVSFNDLIKPVFNITFLKLEESILTNDLRLSLFLLEVELKNRSEPFQSIYSVNVHPLVYIYYMKYKCCRYLQRSSDSLSSLKELEQEVTKFAKYESYSMHILGRCLTESGRIESAINVFALSYQTHPSKRKSAVFHIALILNKSFSTT